MHALELCSHRGRCCGLQVALSAVLLHTYKLCDLKQTI